MCWPVGFKFSASGPSFSNVIDGVCNALCIAQHLGHCVWLRWWDSLLEVKTLLHPWLQICSDGVFIEGRNGETGTQKWGGDATFYVQEFTNKILGVFGRCSEFATWKVNTPSKRLLRIILSLLLILLNTLFSLNHYLSPHITMAPHMCHSQTKGLANNTHRLAEENESSLQPLAWANTSTQDSFVGKNVVNMLSHWQPTSTHLVRPKLWRVRHVSHVRRIQQMHLLIN